MTKTFGQLFGELVARHRKAKGWSLARLAQEAWGKGNRDFVGQDRAAQITHIEDGNAANPQARTIKAMQDALGIPQAEIDALRAAVVTPHPDLVAALMERNAALAHDLKLNHKLVVEIARAYARSAADDFDGAVASIRAALISTQELDRAKQLYANLDATVQSALDEVIKTAKAGELTKARKALDADIQAMSDRRTELLQGEMAAHDIGLTLAQQANDPRSAADHILAKLKLETPTDPFKALRDEWQRWYETGRDKGLAFDLDLSIALAETILDRAQPPDQRGAALNDLGNSLATLGERLLDTALLQRAVTAYEQALLEYTRERVPLNWATTQNNLGTALQALGERQSDPALLQRAVTAYEQALLERTRDREPLDWAATQNNLGNALRTLGERQSDPSLLQRAVTAFELALMEYARDRVPLDWAATQNNLGTALNSLGKRQSNPALLQRAVTAFEQALLEYTRYRVPLNWAATQNNLGTALSSLGEGQSDPALLQGAVTAFEQALLEYTRDRVPMNWAGTQNNLAYLNMAFHRLAPDPARLMAAKEKALAARQVYQEAEATAYLDVLDSLLSDIDEAQSG